MKIYSLIFRILLFIYIGILFFLCLYSFNNTGIDLPQYLFGIKSDKVIHFLMFFPFPFSAWLAFKKELRVLFDRFALLIIFVIGILLSMITESLQSLTLSRETDIMDLVANVIGVAAATLIVYLLKRVFDNVWPD